MNQEPTFRKTMELYTLRNRLHRYWKKLVAVSIGVAKETGVKTKFVEQGDIVTDDQKIHVYTDGKIDNTDELLVLAKSREPSLYRKYKTGRRKYEHGVRELEVMVA